MSTTTTELENNLYSMIWKMATNLVHGGKINPNQFMDYTLGSLFYRFISEYITNYSNKLMNEAGVDANYANMPDEKAEIGRSQLINAIGFYIAPSQLFINVANTARGNEKLNTDLNKIFRSIEESTNGQPSNKNFKGLFNNFNTNDLGLGNTVIERNELLTTLLESVRDLNFSQYEHAGVDVFGNCYEYLIKMYALNSGTKGGEFYTPKSVSYLLAMLAASGRTSVRNVYDPACGSGSLLLNFIKVLGTNNVSEGFFGQEINMRTYNLCRMNMILHNVNYEKFNIQNGDTLKDPKHDEDKLFDAIVSNPPYSIPWDGDKDVTLINDPRFAPAGILAPRSKADLAFVMHILFHLSSEGTAAIIEFPGVLYRGGAEQKIRQYLIQNNYIDTIIQLPDNLFYGTSISTCILILKKNKSNNRVCFIDASNEFIHEGNKNELSDEQIVKIYSAYINKENQDHFCVVVDNGIIAENDFNLSVSTYVEQKDHEDSIDYYQLADELVNIVRQINIDRDFIDKIYGNISGYGA